MKTKTALAHMHVALNVADLDRSIAFYGKVFGTSPAKVRPDYAKFELLDPPLVLSLNPGSPATGRPRLSHLGIRVGSAEALEQIRERLEQGAVPVVEEAATVCCYALQNKLWVSDPDGNDWEFYELLEDTEEGYAGSDSCPTTTECCG